MASFSAVWMPVHRFTAQNLWTMLVTCRPVPRELPVSRRTALDPCCRARARPHPSTRIRLRPRRRLLVPVTTSAKRSSDGGLRTWLHGRFSSASRSRACRGISGRRSLDRPTSLPRPRYIPPHLPPRRRRRTGRLNGMCIPSLDATTTTRRPKPRRKPKRKPMQNGMHSNRLMQRGTRSGRQTLSGRETRRGPRKRHGKVIQTRRGPRKHHGPSHAHPCRLCVARPCQARLPHLGPSPCHSPPRRARHAAQCRPLLTPRSRRFSPMLWTTMSL